MARPRRQRNQPAEIPLGAPSLRRARLSRRFRCHTRTKLLAAGLPVPRLLRIVAHCSGSFPRVYLKCKLVVGDGTFQVFRVMPSDSVQIGVRQVIRGRDPLRGVGLPAIYRKRFLTMEDGQFQVFYTLVTDSPSVGIRQVVWVRAHSLVNATRALTSSDF